MSDQIVKFAGMTPFKRFVFDYPGIIKADNPEFKTYMRFDYICRNYKPEMLTMPKGKTVATLIAEDFIWEFHIPMTSTMMKEYLTDAESFLMIHGIYKAEGIKYRIESPYKKYKS